MSDPTPNGDQARLGRRVIITLAAANFFLFFGAGAQQQYLVTYLEDLTDWGGLATVTIPAGVYFSMMVFRVANVWLLRGWSDRTQTIVGSLMYTLFCLAMAALFSLKSYPLALAAALVWGWGGAAFWAGSSLQILAATDAGRRKYGTGIGVLYTTTHLGFWLGVIGLGKLETFLPDGQAYALYLVAAAVTLMGNVVLLTTPRLAHVQPDPPTLRALLELMGKAKALIASFLQLASGLTFGLMIGVFGSLIREEYGAEYVWIVAHWYPAARLAWSLASGALTDRLGGSAVLTGSFLLTTVSLIACVTWTGPATLAVAAAAFGLLSASVPVVASAIVGDSADRQRRPLVYGAVFTSRDGGFVVAALAGQWLQLGAGGVQPVFITFAAVFGVCGLVAVALQRYAEQRL